MLVFDELHPRLWRRAGPRRAGLQREARSTRRVPRAERRREDHRHAARDGARTARCRRRDVERSTDRRRRAPAHRLPPRGARPVSQDADRRTGRVLRPAARDGPEHRRRGRSPVARADGAERPVEQRHGSAVAREPAAGAAGGGPCAPARPAVARRAVLRPRPDRYRPDEGPVGGTGRGGRHGRVLQPPTRSGARPVPGRGDHPQGAIRRRRPGGGAPSGRPAAPVGGRGAGLGPDGSGRPRRASRRCSRTHHGGARRGRRSSAPARRCPTGRARRPLQPRARPAVRRVPRRGRVGEVRRGADRCGDHVHRSPPAGSRRPTRGARATPDQGVQVVDRDHRGGGGRGRGGAEVGRRRPGDEAGAHRGHRRRGPRPASLPGRPGRPRRPHHDHRGDLPVRRVRPSSGEGRIGRLPRVPQPPHGRTGRRRRGLVGGQSGVRHHCGAAPTAGRPLRGRSQRRPGRPGAPGRPARGGAPSVRHELDH